jgi:small-conductance mechanosensitive channel
MVRKLVFAFVFCAAALCGGVGFAQAPTPAAPANATTPADAQQALDTLQDPKKLAALIRTLQTIVKANGANPAATPAPTKPAATAPALELAPNSLGAQLLPQVTGWTGRIAGAAAETASEMSQVPLLSRALLRRAENPAVREAVADAAWRILAALACAGLVEIIARWILRRPRKSLEARAPGPDRSRNAWETSRRLPYAVARLILWLIPIVVFVGIGNLAAGIVGGDGQAPLVTVAVVNAYAIGQGILYGVRMLFSPGMARLRLLPIHDGGAALLMVWLRRITIAAVLGSGLAEIVLVTGLPTRIHDALIRMTALVVAILFVALAVQCRQPVARRIAGGDERAGEVAEWRLWLAGSWQYFAIAAIVAGWLVTVGGINHRLDTLDFLLGTIGVLVAARLLAIVALGALTRAMPATAQRPGIATHAARYHRTIRIAIISVITACAAILLLQIWGTNALAWFAPGKVGQHLLSALVTIALAAAFAIVVWESVNAALDREVTRLQRFEPTRSVRLRTLLPVARTALLIVIVVVIGATALSEIGVNIAPLLAGAGIIGIAVGFGSQTLVHDIITGMFILIENTIQVGDGVTVAGLTGKVEELSIRTLRLRAADGALHVIPFSSVVTITNTNRGIGNATVSIAIAPDQDVDRAAAALTEIGEELRHDQSFAPMILGDFDLYGVDSITATAVTITGKIPCTSSGRLPVQREFNRRMLQRFAKEHITLAA